MGSNDVKVSEEIQSLLRESKLADRDLDDQVRIALAIHLFQEGVISVGKAAEVSGINRSAFELMLGQMGIPAMRYTLDDYRQDREALKRASRAGT